MPTMCPAWTYVVAMTYYIQYQVTSLLVHCLACVEMFWQLKLFASMKQAAADRKPTCLELDAVVALFSLHRLTCSPQA